MNKFTSVRYKVSSRYDRPAFNQMLRWCKDHISLKGDKWDLEIKLIHNHDMDRYEMIEYIIFENNEYKTLFVLANIDN